MQSVRQILPQKTVRLRAAPTDCGRAHLPAGVKAIAKASGAREIFYSEDWTVPAKIERASHTLSDQFDAFGRIDELKGFDPAEDHSKNQHLI